MTEKPIIGYQIADHFGEIIQGDQNDPSGRASFDVLTFGEAERAIARHPDLLLFPIREGDVEEPNVSADAIRTELGEAFDEISSKADDDGAFPIAAGSPTDWRAFVTEAAAALWPILSRETRMMLAHAAQELYEESLEQRFDDRGED